jgi:hypothetical protein
VVSTSHKIQTFSNVSKFSAFLKINILDQHFGTQFRWKGRGGHDRHDRCHGHDRFDRCDRRDRNWGPTEATMGCRQSHLGASSG